MSERREDLRSAFSLLTSQIDVSANPDPCLEERLMNAVSQDRTARRSRVARVAAATLCFAALIGGTVVAAGGVDAVKEWFATAKVVQPDGTTEYREISESGLVMLDETHGIQFLPEDPEFLRGKEIPIHLAPTDGEPSNEAESEEE